MKMVDSNVSNGSDYSSNDIRSMAFQIPYSEREGSYESLGEFDLEGWRMILSNIYSRMF